MKTMEQTNVRHLILEVMDTIEDPSPYAVAEEVVMELDDGQIHDFAIRGVAEQVRWIMSTKRHSGYKKAQPRSAGWDEVARQNDSGELDLARLTVYNGSQHKWLLDCTVEDLRMAIEELSVEISGLTRTCESYGRLAEILRRKRSAQVVGDLPSEKVREALYVG